MEWPCGWATLYFHFYVVFLSFSYSNVFCQSIPWEQILPEDLTPHQTASKREVSQTPSPTRAQLINALFSYATAKGLLPKTTEIIQSTLPQEQPQCATNQNAPRFMNVVPLRPQITPSSENKPIISTIPTMSLNPIPNQMSKPPTTSYPQAILLNPTIKTEPITWSFSTQNCQGGCLENCLCSQQSPTIWQFPQPAIAINNCPVIQPMVVNEANPPSADLQIISPPRAPPCPPSSPPPCPPPSPPPCPPPSPQSCPSPLQSCLPQYSQPCAPPSPSPCPPFCSPPSLNPYSPPHIITPINNECIVENVYETNCGTLIEASSGVTYDDKLGIPINLQINLPSPSDMCPTITIVTAPNNPEPIPAFSPYASPQPPIIIKRRSSLKKLLPIILLALIDDCEGCGGYPYNCDSNAPIPIPYPIPIPINNPIINCPR